MTTFDVSKESFGNKSPEANEQISSESIEAVRKCDTLYHIDTSWDKSYYVSFRETKPSECDKTPPFLSIMIDTESADSKVDGSTQTEIVSPQQDSIIDVNLSFGKDFKLEDSSSNDEKSLRNKRFRHDSFEDNKEKRPTKKTKCTESSTSSSSDINERPLDPIQSNELYSESEVSFKSASSNYSYKTRKRRRKSDSSLLRNILHRSGKNSYFCRRFPDNNSSGMFNSF